MRVVIPFMICCLALVSGPASGQYPWCSDMDSITAEVVGGDLILRHNLATYNCCPDSFTYNAQISGQTLTVTENEVLTTPCDCMCCFNLGTTITGLEPGVWSIVYRWLDDGTWDWREWYLTVTIGEMDKAGIVLAGRMEATGCLDIGSASGIPAGTLALSGNYPNPFNPGTAICFESPGSVVVDLDVFDSAGRLVRTLLSGELAKQGQNEIFWNGRDDGGGLVSSGVYFYRLEAETFSQTKRMILLR
ncbi:MAG: T9SS type A sorting domain-containing protein [Gemmatimonadales bacterium]|nr:T9SS type A sorting domain-containing protein [Gemmatimonadales bacterium]